MGEGRERERKMGEMGVGSERVGRWGTARE